MRGKRLARLLSGLLSVACLAAVDLAVAPAANAVPGLVVVSATESAESGSLTVTALCPPGRLAVGGSFRVSSWLHTVVVAQFQPLPDLSGYRVSAQTTALVPDPWDATVYAICGDPPDDLQVVAAATARDRNPAKAITANCPTGTRVLGTGAAVSGANGQVVLEQVVPGATGVTAAARQRPGRNAPLWSLTAFAICSPPIPGLDVVSAATQTTTGNKTVTVACPTGTFVHGVGLQITGAGGRVLVGRAEPIGNPPTAVTLEARESTSTPPWSLRVYAVCAS